MTKDSIAIYRIIAILIFLFTGPAVFAQSEQPVIRSTSGIIHISDGKELYKGAWQLSPGVRPDIYRTVNSTEPRQVSFYTDIDSVSFTIVPGQEIDFKIILNGKDTCYTRISTLKGAKLLTLTKARFADRIFLIPIIIIVLLILLLGYRYKNTFETEMLLRLGYTIPLLFWCSTFIGGYFHGDYDHLANIVSELGAIGTRTEVFMSIVELLMALLALFYFRGLYTAVKKANMSIVPLVPLVVFSIGIAGVAFCPLGNDHHATYGSIMLFLFISPVLALILWSGNEAKRIRILACVTLLILGLILTRFLSGFQSVYAGLIQRFFHLGWSVWFISLSNYFLSLQQNATGTSVDKRN